MFISKQIVNQTKSLPLSIDRDLMESVEESSKNELTMLLKYSIKVLIFWNSNVIGIITALSRSQVSQLYYHDSYEIMSVVFSKEC